MEFLENGTEVYVNDQYEMGYAIIRGVAFFHHEIWYIVDRTRLVSKIGLKPSTYDCETVPERAVRAVFTVLPKK